MQSAGASLSPILCVSFMFPFPVHSGGARDIYSRLLTLQKTGYAVDLIATPRDMPSDEDIAELQRVVRNLWVLPRSRSIGKLLSLKPFHYETRSELKVFPLQAEYGAVLLESEFVGGILENPSLRARHRILRVHNDESHLHRSLAAESAGIVERALFLAESYKFKLYSPQVMGQCDALWYISDVERERAAQAGFANKSTLVPIIVHADEMRRPSLDSSRIFYSGALSVPINLNGLIWYLKEVHPQLLSIPGYELLIAGRKGQADISDLVRLVEQSERVSLRLDVPKIESLYDSSAAFINPIQKGAGVKIKTLDAAVAGLPIITTSVGAEGTGFTDRVHAMVADSANEFASAVRLVLAEKTLAHGLVSASQELLKQRNGSESLINALAALADG